jgi:transposase
LGARLLSFNAYHLRMIASSRKKSDRRDSFWIAKTLHSGLTPHPVYIPTGEVRELRTLLAQRECLRGERTRWLLRARRLLVSSGFRCSSGKRAPMVLAAALKRPRGIPAYVAEGVEMCRRMVSTLELEMQQLDIELHRLALELKPVQLLQTIPGVGERVALTIYAAVGDIQRFPSARQLCSYAGLVPSVRQSGETQVLGRITGEGSPRLRAKLVQSGHVLLWNCKSEAAQPLKALAQRVNTGKHRRKAAVVAAARFILRTAFYVLRDNTPYAPEKLKAA